MKPNSTNHEILLFTGTSFSRKQLCEKDTQQPDTSSIGQLQKACWNGLIFEILPDILPTDTKSMYTWEVVPAEQFIDVKIGAAPYSIEYGMSVNPHFFMLEKNFN